MVPLHIRLLGNVDLRVGGAPVSLESGRAESLLGYLLVRRGIAQPRQRIAFMLWPDSTEAQARTNLRKVLHTLRRELPDAERYLEVTPRTLRWRPDAPFQLDLADFEQAIADDRLEAAVEAYTGDLIEGSYDEWVLEERERLRSLYLDALERLQRELEEREDWAGAIGCAERLVRADPLREDAHRALMRLHDARGDRARAVRAYHAFAATAQRELGVEPSAATRAAYEALLLVDADEWSGRGAPLPPLVGRAAERAELAAVWRTAAGGLAQLVLVTGEPGIGKSRLVEELRSYCAHEGALTAEARAYPAEGAVAYEPVVAWLRSEAVAPRLRRLDPAHVNELARLLPELGRPEPLPEAEQRRRLFAALAEALAPSTPLLLVADDVQWFDRATLQFLHYLLRAQGAAPLLIAATARREEIDAQHPVGELVAGLAALGRSAEIELRRLSRAETGLLAERMTGAPLADAETERLFSDSEGNPLFLVEAVQAGGEPTGGKVQAVIAARLARLSSPARELAGVAAAIGRDFSAPVLADASDVDEQAFVRGLDELWRRGIVRAQGLDAYDFSHGRIREAAYEALSPAQRRHHHLRAAQAHERYVDLDAAGGLIAAHYEAAGAADEAVRWYSYAADAAQRLHDHAGAARALERALALCRDLPPSSARDERELAILTALPGPLVALDGYRSERLAGVHERALTLAAGLGIEPDAPLMRSLALAALTRGDVETAQAFGERLRAAGERAGDDVLWVESAWVLGVAAYWHGRLHAAREHLEAALARWRPAHRPEHLLRYGMDPELTCTIRLAHTLWLLGYDEDAARMRDTALALAAGSEHSLSRSLVSVFAGMLALDQRDDARLRAHVDALAGTAGPAARPAEALAGFVDLLDGRAEGLERVRRAVDAGESAAPGQDGLLLRVLVEACAVAGDAQAGLAAADRALGTVNAAQPWTAEIRRRRAEFLDARTEERLRNGWSSSMPPDDHRHPAQNR